MNLAMIVISNKGGMAMKRKIIAAVLCSTLMMGSMIGCSSNDSDTQGSDSSVTTATEGGNGDLKGELVFAIYDNNLMAYIEEADMVSLFQQEYPNIDIEVEKMKDDSEYWDAMKMRISANQLPDIMVNKTFTLSRFKDYLLDLSDLDAYTNNMLAEEYKVDGQVLGLPSTTGYEYVFYWKDMFEEAGVEVPTTWSELEAVSLQLQEHFGVDNGNFMAIGLGAKDEWPTYPYMEFMPALISGNGQNWNSMAEQEEPFVEGTDIYEAYTKVFSLYQSGVLGKDPLGLGHDQVISLFAQKQASILAIGDWALQNIREGTDDISQLGSFYLPARTSTDDPFNVIVQGDNFLSVTTHSKNPELAKVFIEWFMSESWYPDYIDRVNNSSCLSNFPTEKDPILMEADDLQPNMTLVMYDGGGDAFQAIQNDTAFDYKKLGAEMITSNFDLETRFQELNAKWTTAKSSLTE